MATLWSVVGYLVDQTGAVFQINLVKNIKINRIDGDRWYKSNRIDGGVSAIYSGG